MIAAHTLLATALILWPDRFAWFAPALALLFAASLIRCPVAERTPAPDWLWGLVHPLVGAAIVLIDVLMFNTFSAAGFWVAGPLAWLLWRYSAASLGTRLGPVLHRAIVMAGWICLFVNGGYIAAIVTGHADSFTFAGISGYFGLDERGFFAYSTSLLPHVGYLVPYLAYRISTRFASKSRADVALLVGLIVVGLLSLRIAIGLAIAASLALVVWRRWSARKIAAAAATAALAGMLAVFAVAQSPELADSARGIYELKLSDKVSGDDLRFEQVAFWFRSFLEAPAIGHGASSSTIELTDMLTGDRLYYQAGTVDNPFGYEVLLFRLLSEVGLLIVPVVIAYAAMMLRRVETTSVAGSQVGALRFAALLMLIQSQTNSYLNTSGWFFVFYFCIALIDTRRTGPAPEARRRPVPAPLPRLHAS